MSSAVPGAADPVLAAVRAHIAAFNAADLDAVLAGFAEDAVFSAGEDVFIGRRSIAELFGAAFGPGIEASMELRSAVVQGDTVAAELAERIMFQGQSLEFAIAAFYTVRDARLARVKVYREGPADLP